SRARVLSRLGKSRGASVGAPPDERLRNDGVVRYSRGRTRRRALHRSLAALVSGGQPGGRGIHGVLSRAVVARRTRRQATALAWGVAVNRPAFRGNRGRRRLDFRLESGIGPRLSQSAAVRYCLPPPFDPGFLRCCVPPE